jgi:hypothetical protein
MSAVRAGFHRDFRKSHPFAQPIHLFLLRVSRFAAFLRVTWQVGNQGASPRLDSLRVLPSTTEEFSMTHLANPQAACAANPDLDDRAAQMAIVSGAHKTQHSPAKIQDADRIVSELVRHYLQCSTTVPGIFCF